MSFEKVDLGPVQQFMDDPEVSEIMVNGANKIFIEKYGKKVITPARFNSEEEVKDLVDRMYTTVGKRVDPDVPYADMCLADGTRINAIIPPMCRFGISVTFRKFSKEIVELENLIKNNTLTRKVAEFLIACVKGKVNMIFSGGTSTGKTTLLQLLSIHFSNVERVITIEDAAELKMIQDNYISLETRVPDKEGRGAVTLRDLIRNTLRMAPNRIVIGEVRGAEAIDMLQAMATGHPGTIGVVHANTPKDLLARLETMVLMSGVQLPLWEVRKMIASSVNLVVHMERMRDGSRKVTYVTELRGIDKDEIVTNDLWTYNFEGLDEDGKVLGSLKPTLRYYPQFFHKFTRLGILGDNVFGAEE